MGVFLTIIAYLLYNTYNNITSYSQSPRFKPAAFSSRSSLSLAIALAAQQKGL